MNYIKAREGDDLNRLLNSGSEGPLAVELPDNAATWGMVNQVKHLVKVEA